MNTKLYPIVTINGEHYAVDKEKVDGGTYYCPHKGQNIDVGHGVAPSKPYFFIWEKKHLTFLCSDCTHIIATTDKSLSLPLLPLDDDIEKIATQAYPEKKYTFPVKMNNGDEKPCIIDENEELRIGFIEGYKAAKVKNMFSEEDMRKAIQRTFDITHNNALLIKEDCKRIEDDTLDSLKPILKAVELEMEDNQCDGCKAGLPLIDGIHKDHQLFGIGCTKNRYDKPKLTKDGYVIVTKYIYNEYSETV